MEKKKASIEYAGGWDFFTPDNADHFDIQQCLVCGRDLSVKKNVVGATGFSESLAGKKHKHDVMFCKNADKDWHKQARNLRQQAKDSFSKVIDDILTQEADLVVKTRKCTK